MMLELDELDDSVAAAAASNETADCADFEAFCRCAFPPSNKTDDPSSPFYFESDHIALRDNNDYRRLLRTFVLLTSQRTAALHDLDTLLQLQHSALSDPVKFVSQLQTGSIKAQFPRHRNVAELPTIDWHQYTDDVDGVLASVGAGVHSTRHKHKRQLMTGSREPVITSGSKSRPATFNQPWSVEEQRLLEQLLRKYPPERFEARRFAKIASELPGRTTQQVTSRVQKYFIKLAKAGLPVPGRVPNLAAHGGRWYSGRYHGHHHRHSHFYYPASTFLASYAPPVYMSDDDDMTDDDTAEYHQLKALSAMRQSVMSAGQHEHMSHVDIDYTSQSTGVNSYLDPNYMPAI